MNTIFKKVATGTAVLALSTTVFAGASFAAGTSSVITPGSLTMTGISATELGAKTLDGTTQTVTASIEPFTITDSTGSGSGWNVSIKASQFKQADGLHPLDLGALNLEAPTLLAVGDSDSTDTIAKTGGKIDLAPVKILAAQVEGGMGIYTVDPIEMTLTLMPKEVHAGTYTSTITSTLTAGPGN